MPDIDRVDIYLQELEQTIHQLSREQIWEVVGVLMEAWRARQQIFILGNGGSAATASHMANDLNKCTVVEGKPRFKAISLTDNVPLMTAWGNDTDYTNIFVEQILNFLQSGDIVIGISASGNSPNVIKALQIAKIYGARTIGFTGKDGGKIKAIVDHCVFVPSEQIGQQEDGHLILDHVIATTLKQLIASEEKTSRDALPEIKAGVFIDRDGVINVNRSDYVKSWDEFVFESGIFEPIKRLSQNNHSIVVVSNQSAIGRGLVDRGTVDEIHNRMINVIKQNGGRVDAIYYCPHHPDEGCDCRKPRPGLLLQAAQELDLDLSRSYFIGDAVSDIEAALAAGCMPLFIQTGLGRDQLKRLKDKGFEHTRIFQDLHGAVEFILEIEAR